MPLARNQSVDDSPQLKERVRWLSEWRTRSPLARYSQKLKAVRDHFGVGESAAKIVVAALYRLDDEADSEWMDRGRQKLMRNYERIAAKAEAKGDMTNARRVYDSMRQMYSVGGAERIDINVKKIDGSTFDELDDEQLAVLAVLDAKRKAALEEAMGGEDDAEDGDGDE